MLRRRADIRNVEHRLKRQLVLDAEVISVGRRDLPSGVDGDQAWRRDQHLARAYILRRNRGYILHPPKKERRLKGSRRVLHQIEDGVALRTVVENAGAAAHDQFLIASDVMGESEARPELNSTIVVEPLRNSIARLKYAVGQTASARHEASDVGGRDLLSSHRVYPYLNAVHDPGLVKPRRARRLVLIGQEVGSLRRFVELRLNPIKPHAVIERQAACHLPVILRVPLHVVVAILADGVYRS